MALKYLLVLGLLIGVMALPLAQAQLGGLGGLGGLLGGLGGLLNPLLSLLRIQGVLFCTPNGNAGANVTATPVFPNALVQLQCGGNTVSSATTDSSGVFSMLLDPVNLLFSTLLSGCKLAVNTPLASCNASLPSVGGLVSDLQFIGNTVSNLLNVGNLVPAGFKFNANMR